MNKRTRKIVFNLVVIILLMIGFVWVCSRFVHLGQVEYTDNAQVRQQIVPVNSRVQGFIQKIYFDEYEFVHKGDTLLLIEDTEFRLRVAQAEADYQNALAGRSAMGTAVSTAHNNLAVSDAGIDEVRQKRSVVLVKEEQTQRLNQNEAAVAVASAALDLAKLNLSYTVVLAPCDGVTSRKTIQEGQLIQPGQTLLSIVDEKEKWVIANYKETQTTRIVEGMRVDMKIDAIPDVVYKGCVQAISKATGAQFAVVPQDNSAGNFVKVEQRVPVKIVFSADNTPEDMNRLRAGLNVECEVNYQDYDAAR